MKIELNERSLNIIAAALATRPYGEVAELIADIDGQIKAQFEAAQAPTDKTTGPA